MSFGGPKGPTKEQHKLQKMQEETARTQKSELEERKAMTRKKAQGRSSLLSGSETGVRTTLG